MTKYSLGALVAAGVLAGGFATSASAADLGGNCCADLEERIAELEATTARKGNRKVSLTVSGWVNQSVLYWDDGRERNIYQLDGVAPSPEALVTKTYPLRADVCLALPKAPSAAASRLVAFIKSDSGRALVQTLGATLAP